MKKLTTILLVLLTLGVNAQIEIKNGTKKTLVKSEWIPIDTIIKVKGANVPNDSVMYTFSKVPARFYKRSQLGIEMLGDTLIQKTKRLKLEVYRSRRALLSQLIRKYVFLEVENSNDEKIEKYLFKTKDLNITNNNTFWNYPVIDSIIRPEVYLPDTIN